MIGKVLNRIRFERFKNGFSQEYVANELKISQSFYSRVESGKNCLTLDLLLKLAALFGIPPEELLK
jgi:transcriptional regulator with XRE-family HTH domain